MNAPRPFDSSLVEVARERFHIDLLLEYESAEGYPVCVIVENKIGAADQPRQIARYVERMLEHGYDRDQIRVRYLSPLGDLPSSQSAKGYSDLTEPVAYVEHIEKWLDVCERHAPDTKQRHNIMIYKEAVYAMRQDVANLKLAVEKVMDEGIEPAEVQIVLNASYRRCHLEFLRSLRRSMKSAGKQRGLELREDKAWDSVERAKDDGEYGFAFKVDDGVSYGISFAWQSSGAGFYLYTGLFDRNCDFSDVDYALPAKSSRSIRSKASKQGLVPDGFDVNNWFLWTKTENGTLGQKFVLDSDTRHASAVDWKRWAKELSSQFVDDYTTLARLVLPDDRIEG
jgi:hypothetical protein